MQKGTDEHEVSLLDSEAELGSAGPGIDGTSTQEHRVRFDKNGKMENVREVSVLFSDLRLAQNTLLSDCSIRRLTCKT